MITRIYQGRIVQGTFIKKELASPQAGTVEVITALCDTHKLFQDAVNYHLVALAGMAERRNNTNGGIFREQIESLWYEPQSTLQKSLYDTFQIPSNRILKFEDIIDNYVFAGCERPDVLPYVQQFIIDKTQAGEGVIQQQGRELLPKLCSPDFKGNFDYSRKEREAREGHRRLYTVLQSNPTDDKLIVLARKMDLSWSGIKTQPDKYWSEQETKDMVAEAAVEVCRILREGKDKKWELIGQGRNLADEVEKLVKEAPMCMKKLAKNNKCSVTLKWVTILFMYYPCRLTAELLREKIWEPSEFSLHNPLLQLEDDPLILARGQRGYVYAGFTALSHLWAGGGKGSMYESEWDILAFKEALKTFHSFELKTAERQQEREGLEHLLEYMEGKVDKLMDSGDYDDENKIYILGGDPRFNALQQLVSEMKQNLKDVDYYISERALRGKDDIIRKWKASVEKGVGNEGALYQILLKEIKQNSKGSHDLFAALCKEQYQCIWRDPAPNDGKERAEDILKYFVFYQDVKMKVNILSNCPVRVSAAHPILSPRALTYSDISYFGPDKAARGHAFEPGKKGHLLLGVVVRNEQGLWEAQTARVKYSAPRLERDQLGTDPAHWVEGKKDNEIYPWLQPMMKALNISNKAVLTKNPAITLSLKEGVDHSPVVLLNFPVTLNVEPIIRTLGKADLWHKQFLGGEDEKFHLHWPSTTNNKSAWYENDDIRHNGFDVLSVDLGMRQAAAWNLTHVHMGNDWQYMEKRYEGRCIGESAPGCRWYGFPYKQGFIRVNGEGKNLNTKLQAPLGIRSASEEEINKANCFLRLDEEAYMIRKPINILELNNKYLIYFRRLLNQYRHLNFFLMGLKDDERHKTILQKAIDKRFAAKIIPELPSLLEENNILAACRLLEENLLQLRSRLISVAEKVTNQLLPRRRGKWRWSSYTPDGQIGGGWMSFNDQKCESNGPKKLYHAGGISIARIAQVEKLRQCLQSMGHLLAVSPGNALVAKRSDNMQDPCPQIRIKIENMRESRVNEIAHSIVAQALGVRLKPSEPDKNMNGRDVIHGVYERIPGRQPVDFVVLENLSSYRTSLSKERKENSALMLWSHRQIAHKIQQLLEEVFGIPVVYARASYTSRFDCMRSTPGFRPERLSGHILDLWAREDEDVCTSEDDKEIHRIYSDLYKKLPPNVYLYIPSQRGEYFVAAPMPGQEPILRNADKNAAVNIAWRALAAPENIDLLHVVRLQKNKKGYMLRKDNQREKALVKYISTHNYSPEFSACKEGKAFETRCFYCQPTFAKKLQAFVLSPDIFLCMGGNLWGELRHREWLICHQLNIKFLNKAKINAAQLQYLINLKTDDIPI